MFGSFKKLFFVIGILEMWLIDCIVELVNIIGYNFILNYCKFKIGGGVGFYLYNDF